MELTKLPDAELQVMKALWSIKNPASTAQIRDKLQQERPWNLSALQTLLGRLVKKGFLSTEKQGKNRYYSYLVPEDKYMGEESRLYMQKLSGSSITDIVASLYESHTLTDYDLKELKEFIEERTGRK